VIKSLLKKISNQMMSTHIQVGEISAVAFVEVEIHFPERGVGFC
jgi:hypothetical protein